LSRRIRLAAILLALLPAAAARAQPTDDQVKAAFLPRFARYVVWPTAAQPEPRAPFQLCVIGRDPFRRMLDTSAAGESIDGHGVAVRRMATAEGAAGCHLAFVRGADAAETGRMLLALRGAPVLTVTDAGAGHQRGMIHFTMVSARVRFFIDEAQAAERGLSISSRLLALAAGVRPRR
jgi:YfiR/HmsC-like